jgi:Glycosyltransferase family 9 (heptosyltransferase)
VIATAARAARPVAIFSNGYGDHLLALPALRALAALFPGRLALLCQSGVRQSFFAELPLRQVCETEMRYDGRGKVFDAEAAAAALGPCDLLLSLNPWHSPALDRLIELFGRPPSIGFHPPFQRVLARDFSKHSAELAFDVPRCLDGALRLDDFAAPPRFPARYAREAERLLAGFAPRSRILAVHADPEEECRAWEPARFVELLDRFLARHADFAVVDVGLLDRGLGRGRLAARVRAPSGASLPAAIQMVARADCFLGVDSCFLHAADLFRVPGVGLFGPTDPVEWGFRWGPGRHVRGGGAMAGIDVESVLQALESLLAEHDREPAFAAASAACSPLEVSR